MGDIQHYELFTQQWEERENLNPIESPWNVQKKTVIYIN
jgi:hypothetical protein